MQAVGRLGSYITRGVCTVSVPFLPFGGAVDIIVVQQKDGSFKSSPWYVRFGKFQRVLKEREREKVQVSITVNGVQPDFHMSLNNKGEAFFLHAKPQEFEQEEEEEEPEEGESVWSYDIDEILLRGNKRQLKSKSCNFDSKSLNSEGQVDSTASRRSRILRHVFGPRFGGGGEDVDKNGVDSLERAEIAAKLMELKWSTNLNFDELQCRSRRKNRRDDNLDRKKACSCNEGDDISSRSYFGEVHVQANVLDTTTLLLPEVNYVSFLLCKIC